MGRVISMLLAVVGIWACVEVYTNGLNGAFDGALARFGGDETEEVTPGSAPQRAGRAVESAHAEADERRIKLLGD
jgi:hypothetical protein